MHLNKHKEWLLDISRNAGDKHYNSDTQLCLIKRDTVWYAISLLFDASEERRAFGNSILEKIHVDDGTHTPATMLAIHFNISELLTQSAKENVQNNIKQSLMNPAEVEWHDGNVNHPLAAYCTLICGGELCGESWATELGYRKLRTFQRTIGGRQHRFRKQAEMSEYNSPTYTALDLWFLAIIAEHTKHFRAKELALFLEQRLWIDIAMHFHAPTQQFAGPHSRAYQTDSIGGYTALHCNMFAGFGDELFLNPELAERYNHTSNLVQNSLIAIIHFHVPDIARKIAWQKPFPYYFRKTTYGEQYHENSRRWISSSLDSESELRPLITGSVPLKIAEILRLNSPSANLAQDDFNKRNSFSFDDEVYTGGWSDLTTFMTNEYALGTALLPYVNAGHTDSFSLRIRRAEKIQSMNDFRSAYTRGVYNDAVVAQSNYCHITGSIIDESYLYEEGRCVTYQHRNKAIVCYTPKRSGHIGVKSFRVDLIFSHFSPFTSFRVDNHTVEKFPGTFSNEVRFYFHDYQSYGVIIPLLISPRSSDQPVKIWKKNDYLMVSFYNYCDEARNFSREEINHWRNGFVIELATKDEYSSFDEFIEDAKSITVEEVVSEDSERRIIYSSGTDKMEFHYDPLREKILSRKWNGVEEVIQHFYVEAGGKTEGEFCPKTIFGNEEMFSPHCEGGD